MSKPYRKKRPAQALEILAFEFQPSRAGDLEQEGIYGSEVVKGKMDCLPFPRLPWWQGRGQGR